jgi:hypothetical protein
MSIPHIPLKAIALLATVCIAGCGGDDDSDDNSAPDQPQGVSEKTLNAVELDTPQREVFRRLEAEPVSRFTAQGPKFPKRPKGPKAPYDCYRFSVAGGYQAPGQKKNRSFANLCFKDGKLQSVFTSLAVSPAEAARGAQGAPAIPGGPDVPPPTGSEK